jgi:hypothetical protein
LTAPETVAITSDQHRQAVDVFASMILGYYHARHCAACISGGNRRENRHPNAPCLHGHDEVPLLDGDTHLVNNYTTSHCVTYYKNGGCHTYWVCDEYGTPYPSGDPRR